MNVSIWPKGPPKIQQSQYHNAPTLDVPDESGNLVWLYFASNADLAAFGAECCRLAVALPGVCAICHRTDKPVRDFGGKKACQLCRLDEIAANHFDGSAEGQAMLVAALNDAKGAADGTNPF